MDHMERIMTANEMAVLTSEPKQYPGLRQIVISRTGTGQWAVIGMNERETIYREQFTIDTSVFRSVEQLFKYMNQ